MAVSPLCITFYPITDSADTLVEHKGEVGGWIDGHGIAPFNKLRLFTGLLAIALAPNSPGFLLMKSTWDSAMRFHH